MMVVVLRLVAALGLLASSGVHFYLWMMDGTGIVGPLFLLNGAAGVVIALLLLFLRHRVTALLTLNFGVATLAAYILGSTLGIAAQRNHFDTLPEQVAALSEIACVVCGFVLARSQRRDSVADSEPAGKIRPAPVDGEVIGRQLENRE
ncbi:hypothetical protein AB5J62_24410 [Amycolatopsis sp. cg5]|uniref:hypothetical protein n=1 Tax=Amycolatopsis sp. cg5 TaxID=3238802 RepID=UPI003523BB25